MRCLGLKYCPGGMGKIKCSNTVIKFTCPHPYLQSLYDTGLTTPTLSSGEKGTVGDGTLRLGVWSFGV
jgi:hypothetical protein